ncbi:MAG: cell wall metabolism sensor histidine kinase WalK [Prevotella sp.]|nr:cell wall metabolism sensor histidine kinase WalK [Alistipes senegalensis]MCM1358249.1 cell wall metabolism sensor histidine kinase WalK [Prevotella sp.]MCM1472791.1 cell wall metabolism sensor histidine kinase WalK [Muribaculaceae bacterium]
MTGKIFNSILWTVIVTNAVTLILVNVLDENNLTYIGIFAIAVLIGIISALRMSRKITRPLVEVNPDDPKINYSEINPLINKIRIQKGKIRRQSNEVKSGREQLSLITENMSEGIVIADPKTNILSCNTGALKLLSAENVKTGDSIYLLDNSEIFRHCIQDAMGGRNSSCILKTSGGDREIIASPSNITDTINGIVVFIFDVTERQQLETMRREFTSNVSHELKTPLTTIYGISDMLANGIVKPEDVGQFVQNIRSEAERLIILINDIVSLSKLDENSVPRDDTGTDLYNLAEEVIERLRHSADEKDIKISLSGEHIEFTGNKTVLDEIIYNLCDNAIKYNRISGHVEVKISHIPTKILITVSDDGIGIPSEHINRIFERFYRVDKSRSRQINGTGLGLSIVKHGVMYHNGTIRVESIVGKGSVFIVEFPIEKK